MALGAILGAGASIIGSLFGSKSKKQQTTTTSYVDYNRLVSTAQAAGFNPLTALRNGGAAGFSVSNSTTPAAPLSARIADGVSGAMHHLSQSDNFLANFDPHRDAARNQTYRHVEAMINNLDASTASYMRAGPVNVTGSNAGGIERRPSGRAGHLSTSVVLDGFKYGGTGEGGAIEDMWVAYRRPDGSHVRVPNPNLPDGEQMLIPPIAAAENAITRPILSDLDNRGWIKSRPITKEEKRKLDESWLPSWVPRIRYQ